MCLNKRIRLFELNTNLPQVYIIKQLPKEKDPLIQKCYQRTHFLFWKDNEETENKELQFGVENGSYEEIISKLNAFEKHPS